LDKMDWKVGQAKQHFSELLHKAEAEPQVIYNRDHPVAVVISATSYQEYSEWRSRSSSKSLEERFTHLRQILAEEERPLDLPKRQNRSNSFSVLLNELSG